MKKLFGGLMALMIVGLAFMAGCDKDPISAGDDGLVEVAFVLNNPGVDNPGSAMLKGGSLKTDEVDPPVCTDGVPTSVHVVTSDGALDDTLKLIKTFDDGKQTVLVKMAPGDYTITQFDVLGENNEILYASPLEGSYYDNLFDFQNNVEVKFTIEPFTKNKVDIDVLCWRDYAYQEFGYVWFDYHDYEIRTVCFFGDVCTKFYDEWSTVNGSAYAGVDVQGYDFPALFEVVVTDASQHVTVAANYGQAMTTDAVGEPVCVEYLDDLEQDGEQYVAQINLVLPDGSTVELGTVDFDDTMYSDTLGVSTWGGDDAIWEFAVGDCAMASHQEDIDAVYNIPWVPLPSTVQFKLVNTRPDGYFALGNIQPDTEAGDFVTGATLPAFCGNDTLWIHWNNIYNANVYPYFDIPAGNMYSSITMEQWNKINWIVNNELPSTTSTQMNLVQKAIWYILDQPGGSNNSIAQAASTQGAYTPPLGGYIVVLVDPYENVTRSDLYDGSSTSEVPGIQLTIVRFDP